MAEAIIMPKTGMAMEEGVIIEWHRKIGERISKGDIIAEIETDKSTMELESDEEGTLLSIVYEAGSTVPVTVPIAWVGAEGDTVPEAETQSSCRRPRSTPAAKRVAAERRIDLTGVIPSGMFGEIRERDVIAAGQLDPLPAAAAPEERRVPLTNIQKVTGRRMTESCQLVPMVTIHMPADVTELLTLREQVNASEDIRTTINDFVLTAAARALKDHPRMNSSFDGDSLIYHGSINLGMAVAAPKGLVVPVIKDADRLNLSGLSAYAKRLARTAREGRLSPDDMRGSTFSVSNIGMYGVSSFDPIINPPEAGVLGVCAIDPVPKLRDGELVERQVMGLSLTFDHRVVDGSGASEFLRTIREYLEAPLSMLS